MPTTRLQTFAGSLPSLTNNFTQSNPASGTVIWASNIGLGGFGAVSVSSGTDQVWTTKQGYKNTDDGIYTVSAFFKNTNSGGGYGALGFSTQTQDSNAGLYVHLPVRISACFSTVVVAGFSAMEQ